MRKASYAKLTFVNLHGSKSLFDSKQKLAGTAGGSRGLCVRCAVTRGGSGRGHRRQHSGLSEINDSGNLSPKYLHEVCRLIRTPSFQEKVKKTLGWPNARFTDIVFERRPVCDETPDGVPNELRHFRDRADCQFVDVPPGLLVRAKERTGLSVDCASVRLCAIFETYGEDPHEVVARQLKLSASEEDMRTQIAAWSDIGQSMRTESDLHSVDGAHLFRESLIDFFE